MEKQALKDRIEVLTKSAGELLQMSNQINAQYQMTQGAIEENKRLLTELEEKE